MKTKSFVVLLACILMTTVVVFLYGDPKPSIHEIVSQTHKQFSHWKTLKVIETVDAGPDPDEKYLKNLGFVENPRLYPSSVWINVTLPVFVTALSSSDIHLVLSFMKSLQHHFPNQTLIVYDLGLSPSELQTLNKLCNLTSCVLRQFSFDTYPSHVQNLKLFAYRPIIIQEVLDQAGAVLWLDVHYMFTSNEIESVSQQAQKEGLASWSINQPTSALTHPRMFDYFHTHQEKYFFHRMVQPSHLLLYNTNIIHQQLMLPWVKCALVSDCIAPIGAQSSGCRFDKKPLYRYSGCHRYDMSALNVILGIMFDYSSGPYVAREEDKFFQRIEEEKIEKTTLDSLKNYTSLLSEVTSVLN